MQFSDSVPENALQNIPLKSFLDVLDNLQLYKVEKINEYIRGTNIVLCTNTKWLVKIAEDYGFSGVSANMGVLTLQQLILNANDIMQLRGTLEGLKLLVSACCFGTLELVDYYMKQDNTYIILDSTNYGFITGNNGEYDDYTLYNDNNNNNNTYRVGLRISSSVFWDEPIRANALAKFFKEFIPNYLERSRNLSLSISYTHSTHKEYHSYLNKFFIDK